MGKHILEFPFISDIWVVGTKSATTSTPSVASVTSTASTGSMYSQISLSQTLITQTAALVKLNKMQYWFDLLYVSYISDLSLSLSLSLSLYLHVAFK